MCDYECKCVLDTLEELENWKHEVVILSQRMPGAGLQFYSSRHTLSTGVTQDSVTAFQSHTSNK